MALYYSAYAIATLAILALADESVTLYCDNRSCRCLEDISLSFCSIRECLLL